MSSVSVSLFATFPHCGQTVLINEENALFFMVMQIGNPASKAFAYLSSPDMTNEAQIILFFIIGLMVVIKLVFQIYASITIGYLAARHRLACAFGAFIGIEIVVYIFLKICATLFPHAININTWQDMLFTAMSATRAPIDIFPVSMIVFYYAIPTVVFFAVTSKILSKRLNLE